MSKNGKGSLEGIGKLNEAHGALLKQTNQLDGVLVNLKYEGKTRLGKNLKEMWNILCYFEKEVAVHVDQEEECLFPFLSTHVPRLSPLINLFHAEHEDFRKNLKDFRLTMEELLSEKSETKKAALIEKVRAIGTYLIYLLRQHLAAEDESLYKTVMTELHVSEREELDRLLTKHEQAKKP